MRGKLIVLDGNDGSGKKTQAVMLRSHLVAEGKTVLLLSFPRYEDTFFGGELKKALAGKYGDFVGLDPHLASLPYAAERWESKMLILDTLESGGYVVCDRYVSANQIHQGGKISDEIERAEFLLWLDRLEYGTFQLPRPNACVYLDVPPEISKRLMSEKTRDTVENNPMYLENSHTSAQWLIARERARWVHIGCVAGGVLRTPEEIHEEVILNLQVRGVV